MRRRIGYLFVPAAMLAASLLLIAGCLAPGGERPPADGAGAAALEGTAWDLVSYRGVDGTSSGVLPGTRITAIFSPGGKLGGSAGCNLYGGEYREYGNSLSVKSIGGTEMACPRPGVMEQEGRYLTLLGSAARFRIDGDRLVITDIRGTVILTYQRQVPQAPLPLVGTSWVLESLSTGTGGISSLIAGTEIDAVFSSDGKVTGSAGCNRYFADYATSGSSLSIGPAGATMMYCGDPAGLMEQEQRYLSFLGSVAAYGIDGDQLVLKDTRGSGILFYRVP